MKTLLYCALISVITVSFNVFAQEISENEYRSRWNKTEQSFYQEHAAQMQIEEKKKDVQLYMQMGNEYMEKKDYATALMCFRTVVELETELGTKQNLEIAQEQIARIEMQMQQEIRQDLNNVFGKNWPRREEGLKRILDRMPSTYTQKWAQDLEEKRLAAIEAEKQKARDEMKMRRLELEQQVLKRSLEVNEELYVKRLEMLKKQVEIDEILRYARELFAQHNYPEVIVQTDKVLAIDPNSAIAKSLKDDAQLRMEEEKIAISKKEAQTRRAIAEMKNKVAQEARKQRSDDIARFLAKGKELFNRNEYVEAIAEFKGALGLDAGNLEAKLYLDQIRARIDKANNALTDSDEELTSDEIVEEVSESQQTTGEESVSAVDTELKLIPKTNLSIVVPVDKTKSSPAAAAPADKSAMAVEPSLSKQEPSVSIGAQSGPISSPASKPVISVNTEQAVSNAASQENALKASMPVSTKQPQESLGTQAPDADDMQKGTQQLTPGQMLDPSK